MLTGTVFFWDDKNVLELDSNSDCANIVNILKTIKLCNLKW